ncbi:MAG: hypothetical protein F6K65_20415 [Moorea sp. SIO3C2]|nr:hypothetical protein [Moorena sp. SIO3C2]
MGCTDDRFDRHNFGYQPSPLIFSTLAYFEKFERLRANANSKTDAVGWAGIMGAFAGENAERIDPTTILPFPGDAPKAEDPFTQRTAHIAAKLIYFKVMPIQAAMLLARVPQIRKEVEILTIQGKEEY